MSRVSKSLRSLVVGAAVALASLNSWAAAVTQLGFALDGSGSVTATNYDLLRTGLNSALASLPVDGTVEITVVAYGANSATVVSPVVLTAATLPAIQTAISTHGKVGGGTDTAGAIRTVTRLMVGSANFADPGTRSLINLATDGVPNSQPDSVTAAGESATAGIDALSIEAIGSGVSSAGALANMAAIAFPGPATILAVNETTIPNPIGGSWVVPVSDFDALAAVLLAKVQASIGPVDPVPVPATVALLGIALVGMGFTRRRAR